MSPVSPSGDPAMRGPSVLVVEDHPVQQRLIGHVLEVLGWQVTEASDGIEAVAAVKRSNFDLILMDREMPRCGGDLATLAIRAFVGRSPHTVILCCSSDPPTGAAAELYDGVLVKPFAVSTALEMLQQIRAARLSAGLPRRLAAVG